MQTSNDNDYVRRVRKILSGSANDNFDSEDTETELHQQEDLLHGVLHHPKWEKMSLSLISGKEVYQDWLKDTNKSSFLVLSGWNGKQHGQVNASYSWLTQAIIDLTRMLLKENRLIGYRFCGSNDGVVPTLSKLILQMLARDQGLAKRSSVLDRLGENSVQNLDVCKLQDVFVSILNVVQDTVYILLDRPELLEDGDEAEVIMDTLLTTVKMVSPGKLKVMVCISHVSWDPENWIKGCYRREVQDKALLSHIRRDQAKLR